MSAPIITVHNVLHRLWSNVGALAVEDEKRLWMILQEFITDHGGMTADAYEYDAKGGAKRLEDIMPKRIPEQR